jgi:hypothetical protein
MGVDQCEVVHDLGRLTGFHELAWGKTVQVGNWNVVPQSGRCNTTDPGSHADHSAFAVLQAPVSEAVNELDHDGVRLPVCRRG